MSRKQILLNNYSPAPLERELLDEDFEGSDALFDYDLVHKAHIRRMHNVRLIEEDIYND